MQLPIAELGLVAILNENPPMYTFMTIGIPFMTIGIPFMTIGIPFMTIGIPFFQYISALISSMKIEI
jgi:hypothetical protein